LKAAINTINLLGIVVGGPLQGKLSDLFLWQSKLLFIPPSHSNTLTSMIYCLYTGSVMNTSDILITWR
jgi:hypothetical protein